jgi:hypothetical protein
MSSERHREVLAAVSDVACSSPSSVNRRRVPRLLTLLLAGAAVLAGCGSSGGLRLGATTSTSSSGLTSPAGSTSSRGSSGLGGGSGSTSTTTSPATTGTGNPASGGSGSSSPAIPSWVKTGLTLDYETDDGSGYVDLKATTTVDSVSATGVGAQTLTVGPGTDRTYTWTCSADGYCPDGAAAFQFWIDPNDPLGSVKGQGTDYQYLGTHSFTDKENGQTYTVGELHWTNTTGVDRATILFDPSGLVVESDVVSGYLETISWFTGTG